jgi:hypothetical protein
VVHYRIKLDTVEQYTLPALIMSFSNLTTLIMDGGKTIDKSEAFLGHYTAQDVDNAKKYRQVKIDGTLATQAPQRKRPRSMSGSSATRTIQPSCNWNGGECGCLKFNPKLDDKTICDNCSHKSGFHFDFVMNNLQL